LPNGEISTGKSRGVKPITRTRFKKGKKGAIVLGERQKRKKSFLSKEFRTPKQSTEIPVKDTVEGEKRGPY